MYELCTFRGMCFFKLVCCRFIAIPFLTSAVAMESHRLGKLRCGIDVLTTFGYELCEMLPGPFGLMDDASGKGFAFMLVCLVE